MFWKKRFKSVLIFLMLALSSHSYSQLRSGVYEKNTVDSLCILSSRADSRTQLIVEVGDSVAKIAYSFSRSSGDPSLYRGCFGECSLALVEVTSGCYMGKNDSIEVMVRVLSDSEIEVEATNMYVTSFVSGGMYREFTAMSTTIEIQVLEFVRELREEDLGGLKGLSLTSPSK